MRNAIPYLFVMAFVAQGSVLAEDAAPDKKLNGRMPLVFVDYGAVYVTENAEAIGSTLTVGRLMPDAAQPRIMFPTVTPGLAEYPGMLPVDGARREIFRPVATGKMTVAPATPNAETVVIMVGPMLSSGMLWQPASLVRRGNVFSMSGESWTDNCPRKRNAPGRNVFILSLGKLPAGDYTLNLQWREFLWDCAKQPKLYELVNSGRADMAFSVGGDAKAAVPATNLDLLKKEKDESGKGALLQRRLCLVAQGTFGNMNGTPKLPYVQVGTLDFANWIAAQPGQSKQLPDVKPPGANDPVYAVVLCSTMNSYEWVSLRQVVWQNGEATVHLDAWRDSADRAKNASFMPLLVVPLEMPGELKDGTWERVPGQYKVNIEWHRLLSPEIAGLYVEQDSEPGDRQQVGVAVK